LRRTPKQVLAAMKEKQENDVFIDNSAGQVLEEFSAKNCCSCFGKI